jgi:uncharacterized membrane protein YkvA (DUF1232 family)
MKQDDKHARVYSEAGFWAKLRGYARKAGYSVVEKALLLFYTLQEERTPSWAKATIMGALGYFITPLDAVIDLTPGIGYTDDLGVLALAVTVVAAYINDNARSRTAKTMERWFRRPPSTARTERGILIEHEPDTDAP